MSRPRYAGLNHGCFHGKYANSARSGRVRLLNSFEIAELHRHIARLKGEIQLKPALMRRAVV